MKIIAMDSANKEGDYNPCERFSVELPRCQYDVILNALQKEREAAVLVSEFVEEYENKSYTDITHYIARISTIKKTFQKAFGTN